jgi:hypothetical protein
MADQYREALRLHADKMAKFETGPQVGMFRKGADGQAAIQGAEIPGKFFSGRASQVEDMQAFKRLAGDVPNLMQEMKRFALTEGVSTADSGGALTSKFVKWAQSRSGASKELFSESEMATIKAVADAVQKSIKTEALGRVTGPDARPRDVRGLAGPEGGREARRGADAGERGSRARGPGQAARGRPQRIRRARRG